MKNAISPIRIFPGENPYFRTFVWRRRIEIANSSKTQTRLRRKFTGRLFCTIATRKRESVFRIRTVRHLLYRRARRALFVSYNCYVRFEFSRFSFSRMGFERIGHNYRQHCFIVFRIVLVTIVSHIVREKCLGGVACVHMTPVVLTGNLKKIIFKRGTVVYRF